MTYLQSRLTSAAAAMLLVVSRLAMADVDPGRLSGIVETGMGLWQVPGMALAVIDDGEVVMQRGFGRTAPDGHVIDEHTLFANASTTKAMVVAGLLILADEGRLDLDDPVIDHIPELHLHTEALTQQVTLRDLLAHRTGLPSTDFWTFYQLMPLPEQIERLRHVAPAAAPRTRLIYQNTMYELAGVVIERVSGMPWDAFLADRLWRPIGMLETYGTRGAIPGDKHYVAPHDLIEGELRRVPYDLPADLADAAGSAWTSVHDMTLWAAFLLRGGVTADGTRLVSAAGMAEMFEPQQLASPDDFYPTVELTNPGWRTYGLGWFQQDFRGRKIEFHTGSLDGLVAIIGLDRGRQRAVIVFGNRDHAELRHALLWEVMDDSPSETRRDWNRAVFDLYEAREAESRVEWEKTLAARRPGTSPSLDLPGYAGRYASPVNGEIAIVVDGGGVRLETAMIEFPVSHWHHDTFLVSHQTWSQGQFLTFTVGPEGDILHLEVLGERYTKQME